MKISLSGVSEKGSNRNYNNVEALNKLNCCEYIKSFDKCVGTIKLSNLTNIISFKYNLDVELTVISAYTNKPFTYKLKIDDEIFYTSHKEYDSEEVFYSSKDRIDVDQDVYSLIITLIPCNIHDEGEQPHLNEEEESYSSPFDCLKNLEL